MKKLLFLLIFISCNHKVEEYKESSVNQVDTLKIERVKIETH